MMKLVFSVIAVLVVNVAHADDFFCKITADGESQKVTAPYMQRSAHVDLQGFTCSGHVENGKTIATLDIGILNYQAARAEVQGSYASTSYRYEIEEGGRYTIATCTCGLE